MKDVIIKALAAITPDMLYQIGELCDMCDGYEPYYETEYDAIYTYDYYIHIGAFDATTNNLVGFLGGIILDDTVDITGLVHPDYRRQGIFTNMLDKVRGYNPDSTLIGTIPDETLHMLINSSLKPTYSYSELLMRLEDSTSIKPVFTDSYIFSCLEDSDYYSMYANDTGEQIASCNLDFNVTFTSVYEVFVNEDMRNRGIGTTFMSTFIEEYFEEYNKPLMLHVTSNNTAAVKLYEKCGFHTVESIPYYIL